MNARVVHRFVLAIASAALALLPDSAGALDRAFELSQYGHTAWRARDGFAPGVIGSIAQTTDGYMWLGTSAGVVRFDGVRTVQWRPPSGEALPDERIRALLGTADGALWIGTVHGLAAWKNGKLIAYPALQGVMVNDLEEDGDGTIWVAGLLKQKGLLCAIRGARVECEGRDGSLGGAIVSLYRDAAGTLWVSGVEQIWKWNPGPPISYPLPHRAAAPRTLGANADGTIVVATGNGLVKLVNGRMESVRLDTVGRPQIFNRLHSDRSGALWIGHADQGILHAYDGRVDAFRGTQGLSADYVLAIFEDREGNIWVSTQRGLDRFRPLAAANYSQADGLDGRVVAVLPASDGSVWASSSTGVFHVDDRRISKVRDSRSATLFEDRRGRIWVSEGSAKPALGYIERGRYVPVRIEPHGYVDAMAQDSKGNMWLAHRKAGLVRLSADGKEERTPWSQIGIEGSVTAIAVDPSNDSLWLGLWSGGLINVRGGNAHKSFLPSTSGANQSVGHIRVDADGTVWAGTKDGLKRIKGDRLSVLDSASGLPCDSLRTIVPYEQSFWIYSACGIFEITRRDLDAWAAAADRNTHLTIPVRLLNHEDGVRVQAYVSSVGQLSFSTVFSPKAGLSGDGRIWFVGEDGISAMDPRRIPRNPLPPPVHVEQVIAKTQLYEAREPLELPALPRDVEIIYTALTLTVPEKVSFRYKLEGRDADWHDAGNRRRAFYTDLPPGDYRFRVIAANNSGVWNEKGDSIAFSIAPAWWQTVAFRVLCAIALAAFLYGLYRMRVVRLERELNIAAEAQLNERLRISRALHDTLLQSFQGLLLRFETALQMWPSGDARHILEKAIDQAALAVTEGRDAVQGLRAPAGDGNDLAEAIRALGQTLAAEHPSSRGIDLRVEVQGTPRSLQPILRDEVFRIAAEALRNAFHHADASRVEAETHYDESRLRLRIRDDGKGIDASVLARGGREGHFGLRGMRERATTIGGSLVIWSREQTGTEVELTVPAHRAYSGAPHASVTSLIPEGVGDHA